MQAASFINNKFNQTEILCPRICQPNVIKISQSLVTITVIHKQKIFLSVSKRIFFVSLAHLIRRLVFTILYADSND